MSYRVTERQIWANSVPESVYLERKSWKLSTIGCWISGKNLTKSPRGKRNSHTRRRTVGSTVRSESKSRNTLLADRAARCTCVRRYYLHLHNEQYVELLLAEALVPPFSLSLFPPPCVRPHAAAYRAYMSLCGNRFSHVSLMNAV